MIGSGRAGRTMEKHVADTVIDISGQTGTDEHSQTDCIITAVSIKSIERQELEDITSAYGDISKKMIMVMLDLTTVYLRGQMPIAC
ncbi:unnamed protein product [Dibothriocephalus latus]|uniref:Uncharacterized protein n=1 Tax=Dibothriocephalus latus TaxID=60516 RepID=A0A3P7LLB5_DIBLA|nr:unnamed protein product [Dibothriocephalus latus]